MQVQSIENKDIQIHKHWTVSDSESESEPELESDNELESKSELESDSQ